MSFADDVARFAAKVQARERALFVNTVSACKSSITDGSTITGAPGQVVADVGGGTLKGSWQVRFPAPDVAEIFSGGAAAAHAHQNEDGIARPGGGPYVQRSAIGGRHSVSKTVDGFRAIVADETKKLVGGAP